MRNIPSGLFTRAIPFPLFFPKTSVKEFGLLFIYLLFGTNPPHTTQFTQNNLREKEKWEKKNKCGLK